MIWREAAIPEEHFRLDKALFKELEWRVYPNLDITGWSRAFLLLVEGRELCGVLRVIGNPGGGERGRTKRMIEAANAIRKARSSLRRTCRTARFIAFEVWKRDVAAIPMVVGTRDEEEEVERWKSNIRNIVDWLILCVVLIPQQITSTVKEISKEIILIDDRFNGIALPYVKPQSPSPPGSLRQIPTPCMVSLQHLQHPSTMGRLPVTFLLVRQLISRLPERSTASGGRSVRFR